LTASQTGNEIKSQKAWIMFHKKSLRSYCSEQNAEALLMMLSCAHGDVLHLNSICPVNRKMKYFVASKKCCSATLLQHAWAKKLGLYHFSSNKEQFDSQQHLSGKSQQWGIWQI